MADPAAIRTAFAALSPAPTTQDGALAALNAQTRTVTVDVTVQAIAGYLGVAGKLPSFMAWSAAPPSGSSAASVAASASLAFAFEHPQLFPTFAMTDPNVAAAMEVNLAALVSPASGATGPIDASDQTAILALASETQPVWQPALHNGDLQSAGIELP
jgi:hypothetical protein